MELGVSLMRTIYVVVFLDLFAVSMVLTILASYLREELGLSASMAGLLGSVYGVVQFFSSPVVGRLGDARGYGPTLLACTLLCVPAYALLGLRSPLLVAASRLSAGLTKHTQNLARTLVAAFGTEEEKITAYGRLNAIGNLGFMLGPAIAGFLMGRFGYNSVFLLCSAVFALNAAVVYYKFPMTPSSTSKGEETKGCLEGLLAVDWSTQWDIMLLRFLMSFTALLYRNGFNWLIKDKFGMGAESVGYLTSYQGCAGFLSSFFANVLIERYSSRTTCLVHAILLLVLSYLGFLSSVFLSTYAAFLFPFVVATSLMRVLVLDITIQRCTKEERGLMVGASASVVSVARAGAPVMAGVLHDIHYNAPTHFGLALSAIALLLAATVTARKHKLHAKSL